MKTIKNNFINEEIWVMTFGGAFQRANVYQNKVLESDERQAFRHAIQQYVQDILIPQYFAKSVSDNQHIQNIKGFIEWSTKFEKILKNGHLNVGVSQKLINLYLKYQWCLGLIEMPPHCPFDRIIISQLGYKSPPNWTQLDSFDKYNEFVQKARDKGNKKGLTIAEWELEIFERR